MTRHRKFEAWLKTARFDLANPGTPAPGAALRSTMWSIHGVMGQLVADPARTAQLLEFSKELRAESGPGRNAAEEELWRTFQHLAYSNASLLLEDDPVPELLPLADTLPPDDPIAAARKEGARIALHLLCEDAYETYRFKRARDSLGGRRRAACFAIWTWAIRVSDLPKAYQLARDAVRQASSNEVAGATAFLAAYFRSRDIAPDEELECDLLAFAARATDRGTVVGTLDVLVETGLLSEFGALDRLHAWEGKARRL